MTMPLDIGLPKMTDDQKKRKSIIDNLPTGCNPPAPLWFKERMVVEDVEDVP